jgi:hypothetical protein
MHCIGAGQTCWAVLATSEVIPSRAMRALEGEGRGLSHLEVTARGRVWRQLASRGIDRGAQRVNAYLFTLIVSLYSSRDHRPRCRQSMSTECERVFSSAKKLLTPERNALSEDIIEACEYLKAWWKKGLIQQQE